MKGCVINRRILASQVDKEKAKMLKRVLFKYENKALLCYLIDGLFKAF